MFDLANEILLVDDDPSFLADVGGALRKLGCAVTTARDADEGFDRFRDSLAPGKQPLRVAVVDVGLPDPADQEGIRLVAKIKSSLPPHDVYALIVTNNVDANVSEESWKANADSFVLKSRSVYQKDWWEARLNQIESTLRDKEYAARARALEQKILDNVVGNSTAMKKVKEQIRQYAPTKVTVLIQGESGTGKEVVATAICESGPRAKQPFKRVNCAALNLSTLMSELFGHTKGAFTGADVERKGLFEVANKGTVFLDEIPKAPLEVQAALLRVLQERKVIRVGGHQEIPVDVRILAATNKDLHKEVQEGRFLPDLYHRLGGGNLTIKVPPLRERPEDIPLLCEKFVLDAEMKYEVRARRFHPEVLDNLKQRHWEGNVRDLESKVTQLLVCAPADTDVITVELLRKCDDEAAAPQPVVPDSNLLGLATAVATGRTIPQIEELCERAQQLALARAEQEHKSFGAAAKALNIDPGTLRARVKTWQKKSAPPQADANQTAENGSHN